MTGDKDKLSDFKEFKSGYVAFGNDPKEGRITGKGTIKTSCIDFENVSYMEDLKFNLLSVSQICDKKHNVLFTDKECLILSPKFKFVDEDLVILRAPRKNDVYKLVKGNLVRGLPSKTFKLDHSCLACRKAVNTTCYVLNRVLVTKPQMKTPYEILIGRSPNISFMRPFGCLLTILNTLDQLGKFDGKSEEGYLLGYFTSSKVSIYDDVEDLDVQQFIVYSPSINAAKNKHSEEHTADKEVPFSSEEQALHDELVSLMHQESIAKVHNDAQRNAFEEEKRRIALEKRKESANSTLTLSTTNTPSQSTGNTLIGFFDADSDDDIPKDGVFSTNSFDDENTDNEEDGAPDCNNMDHTIDVSSTPTLRIHKDHPQCNTPKMGRSGIW
ncbi:ribonuclease H-like domain-containing protein, partial [Tanacetum coccineum]